MWKDFHDFWLNCRIPVHIIRYEDILVNPRECLTSLFKFIIGVPDLKDTVLERYIELATLDKAPEIYKPRVGRANANLDKYNTDQLEYMYEYAKEQIINFNYDDVFTKKKPHLGFEYINQFNVEALIKSIIAAKSDKQFGILINYQVLSCRKESMLNQFGRKTG